MIVFISTGFPARGGGNLDGLDKVAKTDRVRLACIAAARWPYAARPDISDAIMDTPSANAASTTSMDRLGSFCTSARAAGLQRSGCALVIHDERPPPRRFSSPRIIAMQTAVHERRRALPPLHSQPPVNPARRSPAITTGQPRMMSQMRPDR